MPKIFCGCTFFNELDLLELRLAEIYPHVDAVVLVESPLTYSGQPKPLHFAENRQRFERFRRKLHHEVCPVLRSASTSWEREAHQNNWIWEAVRRLQPEEDDILIYSDLDEIPDVSSICDQVVPRLLSVARISSHWFHFGWHNYLGLWNDTIWVARIGALQAARHQDIDLRLLPGKTHPAPLGWHLSFFDMTPEQVRTKLLSYSHHKDEHVRALLAAGLGEIERRMEAGGHLFGDARHQIFDGRFPRSTRRLEQTTPCCCCFDTLDDNIPHNICAKGHATCYACSAKLKRTDCLLCNPMVAVATQQEALRPSSRRTVHFSMDQLARPVTWERSPGCTSVSEFARTCVQCILLVLKFVAIFLAFGFLGKLYVWIYIHVCDYDQPEWFRWGSFRHILPEALGGFFCTFLLVGCCVKGD